MCNIWQLITGPISDLQFRMWTNGWTLTISWKLTEKEPGGGLAEANGCGLTVALNVIVYISQHSFEELFSMFLLQDGEESSHSLSSAHQCR